MSSPASALGPAVPAAHMSDSADCLRSTMGVRIFTQRCRSAGLGASRRNVLIVGVMLSPSNSRGYGWPAHLLALMSNLQFLNLGLSFTAILTMDSSGTLARSSSGTMPNKDGLALPKYLCSEVSAQCRVDIACSQAARGCRVWAGGGAREHRKSITLTNPAAQHTSTPSYPQAA